MVSSTICLCLRLFLSDILAAKELLKLLERPHVARYLLDLLVDVGPIEHLLRDAVVCQVREKVRWAARVVVIAAKTEIALLEDVDAEGVPRGDDNPHADVKLAIKDQHWVLDVLLDHPRLLRVGLAVLSYWFHVVQVVLSSAS